MSKWYGPYVRNFKNGPDRRQMVLYRDDGTHTSTSYARYLMQEELGRELTEEETVDHIDDDCMNDSISNLQILSLVENIKKSSKPIEWFEFTCPVCGDFAIKRASKVRHNRKQGKAGPFCSKVCAGKWPVMPK